MWLFVPQIPQDPFSQSVRTVFILIWEFYLHFWLCSQLFWWRETEHEWRLWTPEHRCATGHRVFAACYPHYKRRKEEEKPMTLPWWELLVNLELQMGLFHIVRDELGTWATLQTKMVASRQSIGVTVGPGKQTRHFFCGTPFFPPKNDSGYSHLSIWQTFLQNKHSELVTTGKITDNIWCQGKNLIFWVKIRILKNIICHHKFDSFAELRDFYDKIVWY